MGEERPVPGNPREDDDSIVMEEDLGGSVYEVDGDEGCEGAREAGCWRIRRSPDTPRLCSCSDMIGDLTVGSPTADPASKETRSFPSSVRFLPLESRSPVLLFFGSLSVSSTS